METGSSSSVEETDRFTLVRAPGTSLQDLIDVATIEGEALYLSELKQTPSRIRKMTWLAERRKAYPEALLVTVRIPEGQIWPGVPRRSPSLATNSN
jgi:hypothetical protein